MAREDLLENLDRQVRESVAAGATLLGGGRRIDRAGWFYQPTVITDVRAGMPLYDEETFGPVAAVIVVDDVDHAVRLANDTRYGLAMSVWTADLAAGRRAGRTRPLGGGVPQRRRLVRCAHALWRHPS